MHSLTVFDRNAKDDEGTVALRELLDFMEKPQSIGIDNLKTSLRNIVLLALEMKGYETGFSPQHFLHGKSSSLALDGLSNIDKERNRRVKQFWDDMNEIEREMARSFNIIFDFTVKKIVEIKQEISDKILIIDNVIEEKELALEQADTKAAEAAIAQEIAKKKQKRKELKQFKSHVKKQEAELREAKNTQEVINIQNNIIEDNQDFKDGKFDPNKAKTRPNPIKALSGIINMMRAKNDDKYDVALDNDVPKEDSESSDTDDSSSEEQGEKDDKKEDKQQKPPSFNVDF